MICKKCKNSYDSGHYSDSIREEMDKNEFCFSCQCWHDTLQYDMEVIDNKAWWMALSINGHHYRALAKNKFVKASEVGFFLGFGGRKHIIRNKKTGEIVWTNNLWHQGQIPKNWKRDFPYNADFVDPKYILENYVPEQVMEYKKEIVYGNNHIEIQTRAMLFFGGLWIAIRPHDEICSPYIANGEVRHQNVR